MATTPLKNNKPATAAPKPELGALTSCPNGFPRVTFHDAYGHESYVQASSAIGHYRDSSSRPGSSYVWLGLTGVKAEIMASDAAKLGISTEQTTGWVPYPIPKEVCLWTQMHLNREQVAGLIARLQHWLDHGPWDVPPAKDKA